MLLLLIRYQGEVAEKVKHATRVAAAKAAAHARSQYSNYGSLADEARYEEHLHILYIYIYKLLRGCVFPCVCPKPVLVKRRIFSILEVYLCRREPNCAIEKLRKRERNARETPLAVFHVLKSGECFLQRETRDKTNLFSLSSKERKLLSKLTQGIATIACSFLRFSHTRTRAARVRRRRRP